MSVSALLPIFLNGCGRFEVIYMKVTAEMIKEFNEKMCDIAKNDSDPESSRARMDYVMCDTLRTLGFGVGVDAFEESDRWYA